MNLNVDLALTNLHCVTPTDPSGTDEPYLWVFLVHADGSNIRQRADTPLRLSANVVVRSGSGRPGNLGVSRVSSGSNVHVPPALGTFSQNLRPIVLNLTQGPLAVRIFAPGTITVVCIAIDEEAVPRDAMEEAFNDAKAHVQNRINDFFNDFDLGALAGQAIASSNPAATAQAVLRQQFTAFLNVLRAEAVAVAIQSAQVSVMADTDWWNPVDMVTAAAAGLDPDEPIGDTVFTITEQSTIDNSLSADLRADLRQPSTGLGGAWYVVSGYANASIVFGPKDHTVQALPVTSQPIGHPHSYVLQKDHMCAPKGTVIRYVRKGHAERHQVSVAYPFLNYRYVLEGQELTGASGTVQVQKSVSVLEVDEDKFYFVGAVHESRLVTVRYERRWLPNEPQTEALVLSNSQNDGNYEMSLSIEAVLPSGERIPVGMRGVTFTGHTIEFLDGFRDNYVACVAKFLESKWARAKPVIPDDWRTPEMRWRRFEEISRRLDALAAGSIFDGQSVEIAKHRIAARLQIAREHGHPM